MMRTVFFLSDSTGITAETLGHALLTQFDDLEFRQVTIPFVRDIARAEEAVAEIDKAGQRDGVRPVVFSTLADSAVYDTVCRSQALVMDLWFNLQASAGPVSPPADLIEPAPESDLTYSPDFFPFLIGSRAFDSATSTSGR